MDPKKKKIYIVVIAICLILTGVVLWQGFFSGPSSAPTTPAANSNTVVLDETTASGLVLPTQSQSFAAPNVFPQNSTLNTAVLNSTAFKSLQPYEPAKLEATELGRENPFQSY